MEMNVLALSRHGSGFARKAAFRRLAWTLGFLMGGLPAASLAVTGTANYVYDDLGRLIQVIASDGSNVQYAYDAAGNIIGIKNNAVNTVAIAGFTPNSGEVGTVVTLQGSGFDTTPANNTVEFNGQAASVSAATASMLTVTVPTGATTGTLSVSNTNGAATSLASFTVGATNVPPTISSFTPAIVNTGSAVSVTGTQFRSSPLTDNKVLIAGTRATVTAATSTSLTFTAPAATGGYVSVITPLGQATSASKLLIVPSGINTANVTTTGELLLDGTATAISIAAGKIGVYTFDASAGQAVGLTLSSFVSTPSGGNVTITIYRPDGAVMNSCGTFTGLKGCASLIAYPFVLPATGAYKVIVQADATHATAATLTLSSAPTGAMTVDGAAMTLTSTRLAQAPRYTFTATAGQNLTLGWNSSTYAPASSVVLSVYRPDGVRNSLSTVSTTGSGSSTIPTLTHTGQYTIEALPALSGAVTGSIALTLTSGTSGTLALDGTPTSISLSKGQQGIYTFSGTVGQAVGLVLSNYVSTPSGGNVSITIYTPQGAVMNTCGTFNSIKGCSYLIENPFKLPTTGTYQVVVVASTAHASTATLTLSSAPTGTLTIDGAATTITSSRMGQAPRYTFNATAGQTLTLGWSNNTYSLIGSIDLKVFRPDGYLLSTTRVSSSAAGSVLIPSPVFSGPHMLEVLPVLGGVPTGSIDITVTSEAAGTLNLDGTVTNISLSKGQQGTYTFEGTAGQAVGLVVSNYASTPSGGNITLTVYAPNGSLFASCLSFNSLKGCTNLIEYPARLSATGTYTVIVQADATRASTATLTLSAAPTGTLTVDGAATTITSSRMGQAPRYTFTAIAGQTLTLGWSNNTYSLIGSVDLNVFRPDGNLLSTTRVSSTSGTAGSILIPSPSFSGPYLLEVLPVLGGVPTGSLDMTVKTPVTGTLATDGSISTVTLGQSQSGQYTFDGTVGQKLKLQIASIATTPSGGTVSLTMTSPQGVVVGSCSSAFTEDRWFNCDMDLPSTGTYVVDMTAGATAATFDLSISPRNFAGQ